MKTTIRARAFTLIELMVVIAIIGLLSSIILASLSQAKENGDIAKRLSSAKELQNAIELYYTAHKSYPPTGNAWESACTIAGITTTANWVPGLTPTYISVLPTDPEQASATGTCCYLYRSNATASDYKLLFGYACNALNAGGHITTTQYGSYKAFIDPSRDGGSNSALQDWNGTTALTDWAIYTPGAATF